VIERLNLGGAGRSQFRMLIDGGSLRTWCSHRPPNRNAFHLKCRATGTEIRAPCSVR